MIDKIRKFIIQKKHDKVAEQYHKHDMDRHVYNGDKKTQSNSKYYIAKAKLEMIELRLKKINRRIFEKEQSKWKKKDH